MLIWAWPLRCRILPTKPAHEDGRCLHVVSSVPYLAASFLFLESNRRRNCLKRTAVWLCSRNGDLPATERWAVMTNSIAWYSVPPIFATVGWSPIKHPGRRRELRSNNFLVGPAPKAGVVTSVLSSIGAIRFMRLCEPVHSSVAVKGTHCCGCYFCTSTYFFFIQNVLWQPTRFGRITDRIVPKPWAILYNHCTVLFSLIFVARCLYIIEPILQFS